MGGAAPILSKICFIVKERDGVVKKRMILDTKKSGLKHCSAKHQRVLLPRLLDAISKGINLMSSCGEGESTEWLVLDFSDAFWQVPLDPSERRHFCAKVNIAGVAKFVAFFEGSPRIKVSSLDMGSSRCTSHEAHAISSWHRQRTLALLCR